MIYITGDMHGETQRLTANTLKMLNENDTLIICGDFGFVWDDSRKEQRFLNSLQNRKYTICFVDGAHENFKLLKTYPVIEWKNGKVHKICENVFHLMRGQVFHIEGQRVFTMGGGESPDIEILYENDSWTAEAIPTQEELLEGANNINKAKYELDLIITHEPPATIKGLLQLNETENLQLTVLNTYFDELTKVCSYKKWYFGSMHVDKQVSQTQTAVFRSLHCFQKEKD